MGTVSKMTADRLALSGAVATAIEVQGPGVAEAATERAEVELPRGLSLGVLIAFLGAWLALASDRMRAADAAHVAEITADGETRAQRDAAIAALREILARCAALVRGAYGDAFADQVGLSTLAADRADLIVGHARNAVHMLEGATAPSTFVGARIDLAGLAGSIAVHADAVERGVAAVKREERKAQQTLAQRDDATARWERVHTGVAHVFTGLCVLAGRDDLAAKVRPIKRRSSASPEEPAPEPQPDPA